MALDVRYSKLDVYWQRHDCHNWTSRGSPRQALKIGSGSLTAVVKYIHNIKALFQPVYEVCTTSYMPFACSFVLPRQCYWYPNIIQLWCSNLHCIHVAQRCIHLHRGSFVTFIIVKIFKVDIGDRIILDSLPPLESVEISGQNIGC